MSPAVELLIRIVGVVAAFLILPLIIGMMEHKIMAHVQRRLGPMYAGGFHGAGQLVADGVKFLQKEDIVPAAADRPMFKLAPALALVPYLVALGFIPLTPQLVGAPSEYGVMIVLAASAASVLGILLAGWASGNKYSLLGAMRAAAQVIAYEVPLVLATVTVAVAAGSLNFVTIVESWQVWWLILMAPAALVFGWCALAELQRPPFDIPIADSELVAGPFTEYTGFRFAMLLLSEFVGILVMSAMFSVLFLGGWRGFGPEFLGPIWMLAKTFGIAAIVIWIRTSWPRVRADQLQRWAWSRLVPWSLLNLLVVAAWVVMV